MRISKSCKIDRAAADPKDHPRWGMDNVELERDADGDRLVATNGKILAVLPVAAEPDDVAGPVPAVAFRDARKYRSAKNADGTVWAAEDAVRTQARDGDAMTYRDPIKRDAGAEYVKWRNVVPSGPVTYRVSLNPELLLAAAEAIGAGTSVTLEFREPNAPIMIAPNHPIGWLDDDATSPVACDRDKRFAVAMPIVLHGDGALPSVADDATSLRDIDANANSEAA